MLGMLALAGALSLSKAERDAWFDKPPQNTLHDCGTAAEPYGACRLPPGLSAKDIAAQLGAKDVAWWREGDQFVVVARRDTDQAYLCCAARGRMDRVDGDLWALRLRVVDLDRATIEVSVRPSLDKSFDIYRGPAALPALAEAKEIHGRLHADVIKSAYLDGRRAVLVYTPPGAAPGKHLPVVYMADGNLRLALPGTFDPLIASGKLPPMILVLIWPGNSHKPSEDRRAEEYLPGWPEGTSWFLKHESFVTKELLPYVEKTYGASSDARDRVVTGFSSGAAWAISMGLRHPDIFPNVIAQSLVWSDAAPRANWQLAQALEHGDPFATVSTSIGSDAFLKDLDTSTTTRFYLTAGTLEPAFYDGTRRFADKARDAGHAALLETTVGGHTSSAWTPMLVHGLGWAFAKP